jgi:hypothetical protein
MQKLPKFIFVRLEKDNDGSKYPLVYESQYEAATDDFESIGTYKLLANKKIRRSPTIQFQTRKTRTKKS